MTAIAGAFAIVLDPATLLVIVGASLLGMLIGSIPGLTAVMGTALLVPITFFMDPVPAIAAMVAMTATAIFAGDIPGALLRIPGTPASAAYVDEAYALTRRGKPEVGLGLGLVASTAGGLVGSIFLIVCAPLLARIALGFSTAEYFWLALLGLSCAAFIGTGKPLKGLFSLLFGLAVSTVGLDPASGVPRFTFGSIDLMGGINLIPALIGLFAISEIMRGALHGAPAVREGIGTFGRVTAGLWQRAREHGRNIARGSVVGTLVGALPGAGADIAAWIAYAISRRFARRPQDFGKGSLEGLAEAGAANNSSLSGAWVPTLVFGIPGDSITAIVIGVLILKGMEPGPAIFIKQPEMIYGVLISFFLANLLMLPLGLAFIRVARHVVRVPPTILPPLVLMACIVGAFSLNNSLFDVWVMLAFGVIGWLMEENGIPVAPAILGLVLGGMLEFNFTTTLIKSDGDLLAFFMRPVAAGLGVVTLLVWAVTLFRLVRPARGAGVAAGPREA
ncbi:MULTISPECIES: tripartite tricarboxylate transporter permease [Chelatococcus]|uniref:TctA family transporter n=1 Tax=Chelatococcus caeni TaxID=1348468 RepID=A0A840C2P0_9HYPH|nr:MULTISPECIES: tripartite tricarboxylate transporter permease [Chelatococcus]ALA20237.1 C4-dicarboxylate ABC transporter permease [Chelatococcus sp. CO-6]MBB4018242.1 TctA family transporter [Chelatococcus caeni]